MGDCAPQIDQWAGVQTIVMVKRRVRRLWNQYDSRNPVGYSQFHCPCDVGRIAHAIRSPLGGDLRINCTGS